MGVISLFGGEVFGVLLGINTINEAMEQVNK